MGRFIVDGVLVDHEGKPLEEAKDYSALNAEDFLAAVKAKELSPEDALALENARDKPRVGVLTALEELAKGE